MNSKPLISIIITYYRKKKFIKKTLDSIHKQSYKNYELIFVYDDENKNELKFIKNLIGVFDKKKIIVNNKNLGVSNSRNRAFKFCKGKYISFIDSDDIWSKNKLKKQLRFMILKKLEFSFTSYNVIDEDSNIISNRKVNKDAKYDDLIKSNYIGLSTVMFKKKLLKQMKFPNLKTQEDFALWLKLLKKGYKLTHMKQILSSWRKTKNSLSSNPIQKICDAFKMYYRIENKNLTLSIYSVLVLAYNKLKK